MAARVRQAFQPVRLVPRKPHTHYLARVHPHAVIGSVGFPPLWHGIALAPVSHGDHLGTSELTGQRPTWASQTSRPVPQADRSPVAELRLPMIKAARSAAPLALVTTLDRIGYRHDAATPLVNNVTADIHGLRADEGGDPADICLVDCQTRHWLQNMADMLYPLSRRSRRSW